MYENLYGAEILDWCFGKRVMAVKEKKCQTYPIHFTSIFKYNGGSSDFVWRGATQIASGCIGDFQTLKADSTLRSLLYFSRAQANVQFVKDFLRAL